MALLEPYWGEGVLSHILAINISMCCPKGYGLRGALFLNRVSVLALWSFDSVPKSPDKLEFFVSKRFTLELYA